MVVADATATGNSTILREADPGLRHRPPADVLVEQVRGSSADWGEVPAEVLTAKLTGWQPDDA